jgi:hypothetical protein
MHNDVHYLHDVQHRFELDEQLPILFRHFVSEDGLWQGQPERYLGVQTHLEHVDRSSGDQADNLVVLIEMSTVHPGWLVDRMLDPAK